MVNFKIGDLLHVSIDDIIWLWGGYDNKNITPAKYLHAGETYYLICLTDYCHNSKRFYFCLDGKTYYISSKFIHRLRKM